MSQDSRDTKCHSCPGDVARAEPVVLEQKVARDQVTTLRVIGMDCSDEVEAIERVFRTQPGISEFQVNLMAGTVIIDHERNIPPERLIGLIEKAGLKAEVVGKTKVEPVSSNAQLARLVAVSISGALTGAGLLLQWTEIVTLELRIIFFAMGIAAGGWFIAPKAFRAIRQFSLDMNVLMSVAVLGACAIGEWSEGAAVVFLFGLSELLEAFSLNRARRAIQSLLQLAPATALLKRGETLSDVPVEDVTIGEIVLVRSGAKIPLDGEVVSGESSVNQAPITGESVPVEKSPGSQVFAGTLNGLGSLEIKVTKSYADSTLSKIIHLVEAAQSQRAPSQRFVDRFAKIYTPTVFILALLVVFFPPLALGGNWGEWIYRALVLLVIACPCALVISTPVSIVSGLTAMARRGVLIKGGVFLEAIGKLRVLAVDKTGTITEGRPRITRVISVNANSEAEITRIAAGIDIHSVHPLAQAVVSYANEKQIKFVPSENYRAVTGFGAEARIDGHDYFVGNHRFTHDLGLCSPDLEKTLSEIEQQAQSVVVVGHKNHDGHAGEVMGVFAVGDSIRPNASAAVKALYEAGIEKVVILSGDNQKTVNAISKQVGIDEGYGELLPDDKINRVRELLVKFKHVGMIGDGVNDAPAMAAATVGIAMGVAGTDTAIETADIALMQDDLSKIAEAITLGRRTVRIIQVNITFSLIVKAIFLVLALLGHTSLWLAILADTGTTLLVIANALRLLRMKS